MSLLQETGSPASPKNPWMGLASYTEQEQDLFFGRNRETQELLRLIERDTLTVLFGRSGLGKTSLLRAGVIPRLRASACLPILFRIDYSPGAPDPGSQVKSLTLEAARVAGVELENVPDPREELTLWEFFRLVEFWGVRNDPLTPVLVFDQFEEIFTLGRNSPGSQRFLTELADLAENRVPVVLRERAQQRGERLSLSDAQRPAKIVLSLREDYVARLDSLRPLLPAIMRNRFPLLPLDFERAQEVVLGAGGSRVSEQVAGHIVSVVAGGAPSAEQPVQLGPGAEIEPAYLSVMCHELFRKMVEAGLPEITPELVFQEHGGILDNLYQRSFEGLAPRTRIFVEERLLTPKGYRITVPLEEAIGEGIDEEELHKLVDRRLLRLEERLGARHIELSHDLLSGIVQESRDRRREREAEELNRRQQAELRRKLARTRRHAAIGVGSALFLALGMIFFYWGWMRPYAAYYKSFSKRYGVTYPVDPLSAEAVKHRAVSLRITRKSRYLRWSLQDGQIRMVEAVDSLGNLTQNNTVGTYFSDTDEQRQGRERACKWEFIYDDRGQVIYELGRDRFDRMVWGLMHAPRDSRQESRHPHSTKGVFVGADGYPQPQRRSRAEYIDIRYDANGFEREWRFSDRNGRPAAGADNAFARRVLVDAKGRVTAMTSLDADGNPMIDEAGSASQVFKYDAAGNVTENTLLDTLGKPTLGKRGYAVARLDYDKWGNCTAERFFDAQGFAVASTEFGAHEARIQVDDRGNVIRVNWFGVQGDAAYGHWKDDPVPFHEARFAYTPQNRLVSLSYFDSFGRPATCQNGWHTLRVEYDSNGFVAERRFFGNAGEPVNTTWGVQRIASRNDSYGQPTEERFYRSDGTPAMVPDGCQLRKNSYDKHGRIVQQSYFFSDGQACTDNSTGIHRLVLDYDRFGNTTLREYFGPAGPINSSMGYHKEVNRYNNFGLITSTEYFAADDSPALWQGVHKVIYTYDNKGLLEEVERLGTNGEAVEDANGIHRELMRYNSKRQLTHRLYLGKNDTPAAGKDLVHLEIKWYDSFGREVRDTRIGKHGEGVLDPELGIATRNEVLDLDGVWIEQAFFDAKDRLVMGPFGSAKGRVIRTPNGRSETVNYDASGNIIKNRQLGWAIHIQDDSTKGVSVESFQGPDRRPAAGPEGWSEHRVEKDASGRRIRESYFDEQHHPTYGPGGYHRSESSGTHTAYYDTAGRQIEPLKESVYLTYFSMINSVHTPAYAMGLEAGDILWQADDLSFPKLLRDLRDSLPADEVGRRIWFAFEAKRNALSTTQWRMVVVRKGALRELKVPVLSGNNGLLGATFNFRALPWKVYQQLETALGRQGK